MAYKRLDPLRSLFLLCDVQEKFRNVMPLFGNMVQNINKLLQVGRALDVPLIVTEQYPKGLGNTVKEISLNNALAVIPKTKFTMYVPEMHCFIEELVSKGPIEVIIFGLETHVCVLQSAMDFMENDYSVHVVADCCCSRLNQDRDVALNLLRQMGCYVQTSESVIFNLIQDKTHPKFEAVKNAVNTSSADMELSQCVERNLNLVDFEKKENKEVVKNSSIPKTESKILKDES
ncbi:isochorismatase domain-containing protein 1-like [Episyrphus balteatus]|uniref:isochorismatase domain-containing protein 1-like n=1 Tax=Episyrphus balteatus TaxID=286459 RepID=UPI0024856BCE|nr:isochorismatase domain-containing protein 1-like [Episyrphus balteatus]